MSIAVARQKTDRDTRGERSDYSSARPGSSSYRSAEPRQERTGFSSLERRTRRDSERSNDGQARGRPERPQLDEATQNARAGIVEPTPESLAGRPKLKLAPRASASQPAAPAATSSRSSIFGDARPREAVLAERGPTPNDKTANSTSEQSSSSLDKSSSAASEKSSTADSSSAGKYQAKQPSASSAARDYKARQSQPAAAQPQNGGEGGKKERHNSHQAAERATKAYNRQSEEKPIIAASNAFAGLGVDDDDQ